MNKIIFLATLTMFAVLGAEPDVKLPPLELKPSQIQLYKLQEISLRKASLELEQENVRLTICLDAGVTTSECGQFNRDGSVVRIPKQQVTKVTK